MKKFLILFSAFICIVSCKGDGVDKPEKLLSESQMIDILYDISLLQAMNTATPGTLQENDIVVSEYIYGKYDIDSLTFMQNQRYYASKLEQYQKINERVKAKLIAEKKVIDSLVKEEKELEAAKKLKQDTVKKPMLKPVKRNLNLKDR